MATEDDKVRIRIAEIMSSGGVGYNQISLEILYLLPVEFINRYIEVWEKAMGPGIKAPGDAMAHDAELGKANTDTKKKGQVVGAGAGGVTKRFKRILTIRDERALMLKDRMDKRLRNMAREMRLELSGLTENTMENMKGVGINEMVGDGNPNKLRGVRRCQPGCGKLFPVNYQFCPFDGSILNQPDD